MSATGERRLSRWAGYSILLVGILSISTGSILARLAKAPALTVGAWRVMLATVLLTPWALPAARREWPQLERRDWLHILLSGTALALHFSTWITSLEMTTVASSVLLVQTNPIWVGLVTHFLLGERASRRTALAIGLAVIGAAVLSYGDIELSQRALYGDLLALVGALGGSAYLLFARSVRRKLSTIAFVWPCYGTCGILLILLALITGQPLVGYPAQSMLVFVALAIFPQILGHSSFNMALGYFSPIFVTLALLFEPLGAGLLAWLILSEVPQPTAVLGGLLIMIGVYIAAREEQRPPHTQGDEAS